MKKMGLLVCLAIALLAVGGFVYFRYFATVYDKEGMVVSTGSKADQEDPSGKRDTKLEEEPIDGGVTDASDPQAPRSIQSSELISFSCWFSTLPMEDSPLGSKLFDLEAKLAGDQVQGQYRVSETMGSWQEQSFEADASFMEELNGILDSFDAAGYNGLSHHTAGIPEEYGAVLEAEYASGESIFASDNEDNFLSYGLMDALDKLFARTAADVPVPIAVSVKDEFRHETAGTGDYFISYPTYHIKKGDKPLKDALRTINEEHRGEAADAEERMKQAVGEKSLYYQSEPFFTRGDDRVVAAYERLMRMESQDQPQDIVEYRTYNIDVRTGKELGFADVFRDMEHLPGLIAEEVVRAYPERTFYDEMTELISTSVSSEDESISFALAYGGVHIFADEYYLSREPGSLHILLDTASAPDQWKAAYETMPER
ncbi:MAG: hypothetical protein IJV04_08465, partial [Lachnospiraceae bacterium]|nr:hypothetical protein [Lachnospiraceae bacterium]